ncbi:cyclic-di-AMP receptor [Clostridium sp. JNZ J1-5]
MKLVIAVIQDDYSDDLIDIITEAGYGVTKLATTGGFLKSGNTTLMIGVKKEEVDTVIGIIKDVCKKRNQIVTTPSPVTGSTGIYVPYTVEVEVGGATIFVVDVDKFVKI